jgi:hypothetical protein
MPRRCRPTHKARTLTAAGMAAGGVALLLSGCSNPGDSLARQACVHVDASIRLFTQAEHDPNASSARHKANQAAGQLAAALPLAAQANSADPAYNPLMTTLQEIGRTSESNLIPALRAQCSAAANPTAQGGVTGSTTPAT